MEKLLPENFDQFAERFGGEQSLLHDAGITKIQSELSPDGKRTFRLELEAHDYLNSPEVTGWRRLFLSRKFKVVNLILELHDVTEFQVEQDVIDRPEEIHIDAVDIFWKVGLVCMSLDYLGLTKDLGWDESIDWARKASSNYFVANELHWGVQEPVS